jgi:hypothetical protein
MPLEVGNWFALLVEQLLQHSRSTNTVVLGKRRKGTDLAFKDPKCCPNKAVI